MIIKSSFFRGEGEHGQTVFPLFGASDAAFEKLASGRLHNDVAAYINQLRPSPSSQYVLVNALGASEYYSSNVNGDAFPEAALIHAPGNWQGKPVFDRTLAKDWPYGYPTFYSAHPFLHHRNSDPNRAYGEVELAVWNDYMKRVELVVRVDHSKCLEFGGLPIWDKLQSGLFVDVSMGARVPFDTNSITLDWDTYTKAQATYDPKIHKHTGQAVLAWHKKNPIRGLNVTTKDYDDLLKLRMNKILPDGRKIFVYNDYPAFFDISFVFIGADKTAKVMVYIARGLGESSENSTSSMKVGSASGLTKVAGVKEDLLAFLGKSAEDKQAEIEKEVIPSQFLGKAIPLLAKGEPNLPGSTLSELCKAPLSSALSTPSCMGIVLKPREFQRIIVTKYMGNSGLADDLDSRGILFPKTDEVEPMDMSVGDFLPSLAKTLMSSLQDRSALDPIIRHRVIMIRSAPEMEPPKTIAGQIGELLNKVGAAYNGYRQQVLELVPSAQDSLYTLAPNDQEICKIASMGAEEVFTKLSYTYLREAHMDDLPSSDLRNGTTVV